MASKLSLSLAELKRPRVGRVGVVYAVVGIGVIRAADHLLDSLEFSPRVHQLVPFLVILVLSLALILSWALEVTPQGIQRASGLTPDQLAPHTPEWWSPSPWPPWRA